MSKKDHDLKKVGLKVLEVWHLWKILTIVGVIITVPIPLPIFPKAFLLSIFK